MQSGSRSHAEQAYLIGPDSGILGVLTPARRAASGRRPALILLNAGVLHRTGPHRLHVDLARSASERGWTAFRLDLSGIGDSRSVPGTMTFRESAVSDVRAAIDSLASENIANEFTLFGVCSGADNALATAVTDSRVSQVILVDPPAYETTRSKVRQLAYRVRAKGSVGRAIQWLVRASGIRTRRDAAPNSAADDSGAARMPPPATEFLAMIETILGRGGRIHCVYSGALGARFNAPGQLYERFPSLRGRVDTAYFPLANHVFTERRQRLSLISQVVGWLTPT